MEQFQSTWAPLLYLASGILFILALRNRTVVVAIFAGVLLAACGGGEPAATTEEIAVETELTTDSVSISDLEAQLADQVQSFEALFASGNMADTIDFMPPKLLAKITETPNVTIEALKEQAQTSWEETISEYPFESITFDLNAYNVTEVADGKYYKRVPTEVVLGSIENPTQVSRTRSDTLAIYDAKEWYIVRLNGEAHANYFNEIYPEYADVQIDFPAEETLERGNE